MAYATGSLVGPILGGELYDLFSFSTTTNVFAISALAFAFIYVFCSLIPECRGKEKIGFTPLPEEPPSATLLNTTVTEEAEEPFTEKTYLIPKQAKTVEVAVFMEDDEN